MTEMVTYVWEYCNVSNEMQDVVPYPNVPGLVTHGSSQLSGVLVGIQPNLKYIVDQSQYWKIGNILEDEKKWSELVDGWILNFAD